MNAAPVERRCETERWEHGGPGGRRVIVPSHYMRRIDTVWTCIHCGATK